MELDDSKAYWNTKDELQIIFKLHIHFLPQQGVDDRGYSHLVL
jgi:diadenosine tetraphosphate (Ap4A) HIT family hydrolase